MIGIAGSSCSGKTALAKHLQKKLGQCDCSLIETDSYYHDLSHLTHKEIEEYNYDVPEAIEEKVLIDQIRKIAKGKEIQVPVYEYTTHTRLRKRLLIKPAKFVIVEGLFALRWEAIREMLNLKIFINIEDAVCRSRRLARDTKDRGASYEYVLKQYKMTVYPMYEKFIKPTKRYADIVLNGEDPLEKSILTIEKQISKFENSALH